MRAIVLTALALALVSACSIDHKSGAYACSGQSSCSNHPGTQCINGFCVAPGAIDSPIVAKDSPKGDAASQCPAPCTSCNVAMKTCTVDCSIANCTNQVTCPSGYKCDVQCKTDGACKNGVNCQLASACTVECSGGNSCKNVQCGLGPCDVMCSGVSSCRGVSCGNSCACDVLCTGSLSCGTTVQCTSPACQSGNGCTSVPAFCHSC
jgi:hypothetical protein